MSEGGRKNKLSLRILRETLGYTIKCRNSFVLKRGVRKSVCRTKPVGKEGNILRGGAKDKGIE